MPLKKYVLFLNGKKIYSKRLKAADQGATFHHTIENDFVPDGLPKALVTEFDIKVGEAPPPVNQPPVITVNSSVNVLVGTLVTIAAVITDADGSIATIDWKQISLEPQSNFVTAEDKKSISFTASTDPAVYIFEVTATDDKGATASRQITVTAKTDIPPPPPPDELTARLLAFADNDTTDDAEAVLDAMDKVPDVSEYEFVGDGPYSTSGTAWVGMMQDHFTAGEKVSKLRISQGNHDNEESESKQTEEDIEAWLPSLNNSNEALDWTSSGKVGNVYVISGNTQDLDVEFARDQFNWLKTELEKAKAMRAAGEIDWIVYLAHKPFFTLKSSHSPYTAVRFLYKDIFRDAQVDFVLHGHNHNTQLWKPMIPSDSTANGEGTQLFSLMPDGSTYDFTKDHGALYIITGHAGHEWNSINDSGSGVNNVMHYRDSGKFGFTQLDFFGKEAVVKSIDIDGNVHYEYKVSRKGNVIVTPPECEPGTHWDPVSQRCIPNTQPGDEFDENGVKMLYKRTGQKVDMEVGGDPAGNGQRYNVNHKYQNYMMIGYFKTGPNQELIEMKTDGPNHGSCTSLPKCCWTEPAIELDVGRAHISSEWPHPQNHPAANAPSAITLNQNLKNKWIGYAVVAYQTGEFRTIEQWCDPTGLSADGKPNNNWVLTLKEEDRGQVTNPELAKRQLFTSGAGMEAEIRMHGDTGKHGTTTDMKFCRVYEIQNPSTS